jgi:hypothetical protein
MLTVFVSVELSREHISAISAPAQSQQASNTNPDQRTRSNHRITVLSPEPAHGVQENLSAQEEGQHPRSRGDFPAHERGQHLRYRGDNRQVPSALSEGQHLRSRGDFPAHERGQHFRSPSNDRQVFSALSNRQVSSALGEAQHLTSRNNA